MCFIFYLFCLGLFLFFLLLIIVALLVFFFVILIMLLLTNIFFSFILTLFFLYLLNLALIQLQSEHLLKFNLTLVALVMHKLFCDYIMICRPRLGSMPHLKKYSSSFLCKPSLSDSRYLAII